MDTSVISALYSMRNGHQGLNETVHNTEAKPNGQFQPFLRQLPADEILYRMA